MNFLEMMHYAQYWYLVEKTDYGKDSSFAAKGSVAALLAFMTVTLLDIAGFKFYEYVNNYTRTAISIALPYLIVHFYSLKKETLENEENKQYLKKGKMYLDICTYFPILYIALKLIFKYSA
jgi:hypothetical protein